MTFVYARCQSLIKFWQLGRALVAVAERLERTVRRMDYPPGQKNGRCREVALVDVAVYGNFKKAGVS